MKPAAEPVREESAAEFSPLAALAPQLGFSVVGFRRLATAGRIPGARRLCGRWVVHLPTFRSLFGVSPETAATPSPPAAPAPRRRGRPLTSSDLDRVLSSGYTCGTGPGRA